MKKLFSYAVLLSIFTSTCYSQNWLWAKTANGGGQTKSVFADAEGNVFVTGNFSDSITFGPATLTGSGTSNVFIVKYNTNGNVLWAKNIIGGGRSSAICADVSGNVFVTGSFSEPTITIGSESYSNAGGFNPGSAGNGQGDPCTDFFIAKCDATGNVLWSKRAGGARNEYGVSVSADLNGNLFVMGSFQSTTVSFDPVILINSDSFAQNQDLFITKYDANGNVLWAKNELGIGRSISTDAIGNLFLTGSHGAPLITKYDTNGNVLWTKSGTGNAGGSSISTNANGDVFLVGPFNGPSITFGSTILNSNGPGSVFIAKCDANGTLLWATTSGGTDGHIDDCHSVCADAAGGAFVTGYFQATAPSISFGSITLSPPSGNCAPYCYPVFIVSYDANGNEVCAAVLASGGAGGTGVASDPYGNAYLAGGLDINPLIIGTDTLSLTGGDSFFLAKYNCDNTLSVTELGKEANMLIYPNPSFGIVTINLTNTTYETQICLYDVFGRRLDKHNFRNETHLQIDLSNRPKGLYFIELMTNGRKEINKIILN